MGRPSDALLNLEPAVDLFESVGDSVGLVNTLARMCNAQRQQGQLELSLATARRAESMSLNDIGVINSLGNALWTMGRFEEALVYQLRELELDIKQHGKRSRSVAASMMNLGYCLFRAGQRDEGISTLRRVVTLLKELNIENTALFANACNSLGACLSDAGQLAEALSFLTRALELRRKLLPPDHPKVAMNLNNIAVVNEALGNADAALQAAAASAAVARRSQSACAGPGCTRSVKADGRPLEQCGKCRRTCYCSVACQTADWKREGGHKAECKALVAEGVNVEVGVDGSAAGGGGGVGV